MAVIIKDKLPIRPVFDYILVKPLTSDTETPSGLIIPDMIDKTTEYGEIVALGTGRMIGNGQIDPLTNHFKVGDVILHSKFGLTAIDDGNYLLMTAKDVKGVRVEHGEE